MLQKIIANQKIINLIFFSIEISLLLVWLAIWIAVLAGVKIDLYLLRSIGNQAGVLAIILFLVTLLPGIFNRLNWRTQWLKNPLLLITLFRRHLGIMMFLLVFIHLSFVQTVPTFVRYIMTQSVGLNAPLLPLEKLILLPSALSALPSVFVIFGMIGWLLLLPVWLTSNDYSMKKLGKNWKKIQRLTYLAIWLIFLHVAWQKHILAIPIVIVGLLEVASWVVFWRKK